MCFDQAKEENNVAPSYLNSMTRWSGAPDKEREGRKLGQEVWL